MGAFDEHIRGLDAIVDDLAQRLVAPGGDVAAVAGDAVAELTSALEELVVAGEELATQAEALAADRAYADQQRRYFEDLFASGPAPSLVTDAAGEIVTANEPAAVLLGVARAHLPGKPLSIFVDESNQAPMFRLMRRADQHRGRAQREDIVLRNRRGEPVQIVATVAAAAAPDGALQHRWLLDEGVATRSFADLTPGEQELRTSAIRLDAFVGSASDAIVSADGEQRIILFNQAAERIFGWRAEDIIGEDLGRVIPAEARQEPPNGSVGTAADTEVVGHSVHFGDRRPPRAHDQLWLARKDGSRFPADVTTSTVQVDGHTVTNAIIRDVSERERQVRELQFAEEFGRRIIDTVGALVVVLDPAGRILVFNDACERATGYRSEDVVGHDVIELLITPDERPAVSSVRDSLVATRTGNEHENDWVTVTGERVRIKWSNSVLVDEQGNVTQVIGTGIDVTQERALEAQVMAAQRLEALGQLASGVAHDFNNVLSIMRGHLELLADEEGLPGRANERIDAIGGALRRATALVSNLTTINQRAAGGPQVIHVNDATESLGRLLDDVLGADVVLELRLHAGHDLVVIDPTRFEQVLLNLVVNACDAMDGHGLVTVATASVTERRGRPELLLTVTDSGRGMDAATQARAFDAFFTTKDTGSGLGLATTRLIVESVGGTIDVDSQPDAGATFSVRFPVAPAADESTPGPIPPSPAPGLETTSELASEAGSPRRILVVDDEPQLLAIARDHLEAAGYEVLTAGGAAEAHAAVTAAGGVDLLLTDIVMPELDGGSLAAALLDLLPGLPVVFMTARHPVDFVPPRPGLPVLDKPFGRRDLLAAVRAGFDRSGAE